MVDKKIQENLAENKDMKIGFHLGTIDCLKKEREELVKLVKIVEELMVLHAKELQKLGVDITKSKDTKLEDNL